MIQRFRRFFSRHRGWIAWLCLLYAFAWGEHLLLLEGYKKSRNLNAELWLDVSRGKIDADVLVLGSSRALLHYDCRVLEKALPGKSCYTAGMDGGFVQSQLALLKVYLKYNKAPEIALVDTDRIVLNRMGRETVPPLYNPAQYLPYLHEEAVWRFFCTAEPACLQHRWIPLYSAAVYGKEFWLRALMSFITPYAPMRERGFYSDYKKWDASFDVFKSRQRHGVFDTVDTEGLKYQKQIFDELKTRGTRVVAVHSPEYDGLQKITVNYRQAEETLRSFAARNQVVYWDFTRLTINRQMRYFKGSRHLNFEGAQIFSRLLAQRLQKYFKMAAGSNGLREE